MDRFAINTSADVTPGRESRLSCSAGLDHYFSGQHEQIASDARPVPGPQPCPGAGLHRAGARRERHREGDELLQTGAAAFSRETENARRLLTSAVERGAHRKRRWRCWSGSTAGAGRDQLEAAVPDSPHQPPHRWLPRAPRHPRRHAPAGAGHRTGLRGPGDDCPVVWCLAVEPVIVSGGRRRRRKCRAGGASGARGVRSVARAGARVVGQRTPA